MTVHLLGTGAARSDAHRTTTMLAIESGGRLVLVDCGGDALQRMLACGLDVASLDALVVTHEHPDHIAGFPLLIERLWLHERAAPLPIVGNAAALAQARRSWEAFDTSGWTGLFAFDWRQLPDGEGALAWEDARLRITASPVVHGPPTHGLRIEERGTGRVAAYSCDTEPCDAVAALARGADLLVHEATGAFKGHSSAAQAAAVAARAGARRCVLVHLPPGLTDDDLDEARATFADVRVGVEGEAVEV